MNKKIIIVLTVIVLAVGGYLVFHKSTPATQSPAVATTTTTDQNAAATITYTNDGFGSSNTVVKSGDLVAVTNTSSVDLQLESDPHPVHTDDTDLNVGTVASGKTVTFTVTKKGTFGYHNHLDPTQKGTITIQ